MSNAIGCDLSRYNIAFNPSTATGQIDFAIQKATQGYSYVDLEYENIWKGVSQIGIRGSYHYQMSGLSWVAQADHFLEVSARHDYHLYALDVEEIGNVYSNTFFADTKRIIDYWRTKTNKKIVLYTNGSTYNSLYYALIKTYGAGIIAWLNELDLWLASPSTAGYPVMPITRKTWNIHQYSWTGIPARWGTGGTRVDENVFNGNVDMMKQWLSILGADPIQGEIPMDKYKVIWSSGCNKRTGPNVTSAVVGVIPFGGEFNAFNYYIPAGKTAEQERWGQLEDSSWVALVYNSQPRASLVAPVIPPPSTEYILYVKDGITKKFIPE